jgi:hypothetical protein
VCDYTRSLERIARVNPNHRREFLARHTDALELLAAADSEDAMRRVSASLQPFGGIGGPTSEADGAMSDEMWTTAEAADFVGVTPRSLLGARADGRVEAHHRAGRLWMFARSEVVRFKESRQR